MEMESFVLLHLAQCAKVPVRASACAIVVSDWQGVTDSKDLFCSDVLCEGCEPHHSKSCRGGCVLIARVEWRTGSAQRTH